MKIQESLTEGEGEPLRTNYLKLAHFTLKMLYYLFYKTSYPKEGVNYTQPFPSDSVHCLVSGDLPQE
jgi:hypothetical protein